MMNKKRNTILYLRSDISYTELTAGGSVSHTLGVVQGFLDCGYEVVCASSVMISLLQKLNLVCLKKLRNPKIVSFLKWRINCILSNIFFLLQLLPLFKRYPIEYIYQRYTPFNFTGVVLSKLKKVSLILEYNGSEVWVDAQWTGRRRFGFSKLMHTIEMINLSRAQHIVVVSEVLKDELCERGIESKKIIVNPNGVNTDLFDPVCLKDARVQTRKKLCLHDDAYVIGFVGTFNVWHGIEVLVEMIPALVTDYPHTYFLLIGDGPLLLSLQQQLQKVDCMRNVICTGMLSPDQTRYYLAACDAFISPTQPNKDGTRFFGSPTKLFEYMSMAKPIIVSDLEQLAEVVLPAVRLDHCDNKKVQITDEVGVVVATDNTNGFVDAAAWLLSCDKKSQQTMGANARNRVVTSYTWKQHVRTILDVVTL